MGKLLCEKIYGTFGVEMRAYGQKLVRNWSNFAHTQVSVTVFKTSRHSKLLFFVKKQRTLASLPLVTTRILFFTFLDDNKIKTNRPHNA